MQYFLHGFGVFLGVIAGVAVSIATQTVISKREEKQKIKNLKFEIKYNLSMIDKWVGAIGKFRDAVAASAMNTWHEYLQFSHIMKYTISELYESGILYKYITTDEIGNLNLFLSDFTQAFEIYINQDINSTRQNFDKDKALTQVMFLENKLQTNKKNLEQILKSLP